MFIDSIFNGLKVLIHWQTYVIGLIYMFFAFLPAIIVTVIGNRSDNNVSFKSGCTFMIIQPFFQAFGIFIAVGTLLPIMMFGRNEASWSAPWLLIANFPMFIIVLIFIMVLIAILGGFIPILGQATSFLMFITGGVAVAALTISIGKSLPQLGVGNIHLIPGFFTVIGFVLISAFLSWIGIIVSGSVVGLIFRDREDISQLIMMPLGSVFGFLSIFIYAAWIGVQLNTLR